MNSYEAFKQIFIAKGEEQVRQKIIKNLANSLRVIDSGLSEEKAIDFATKIIQNNLDDEDIKYLKPIVKTLILFYSKIEDEEKP